MKKLTPLQSILGGIVALGVIGLLIYGVRTYRGKGNVVIKANASGLEVNASAENPAGPATIASGIKTGKIESGADIKVQNSAPGGVETGDLKAKDGVSVANGPAPTPK